MGIQTPQELKLLIIQIFCVDPVSAMVTFVDGKLQKRLSKI